MNGAADVRALLARRQLPSSGWAGLASSPQASLETSALAYMALSADFARAREGAREFFLGTQNPNGSWPAFAGDDKEGCWATSLVLIALGHDFETISQRLNGVEWLLQLSGQESHWLWKWKFRTADRHVRFDPDKFGWPWIPHTNSWVAPTAFSILALDQLPCDCSFPARTRRIEIGVQMLLDRACPGGGWNAGNGIVYGNPMAPHPDVTAIALLALRNRTQDSIVRSSIAWLEKVTPTLNSPWSLGWSILALATHQKPTDSFLERLSRWPNLDWVDDSSTLAVISLALDHARSLALFGFAA